MQPWITSRYLYKNEPYKEKLMGLKYDGKIFPFLDTNIGDKKVEREEVGSRRCLAKTAFM